ncbi:MAG TPA: hypothetical protein VHO92_00465 [Methanobacterium sp.]|nr:hypothetical protein [Methanobacterium sp.]
MDASVYETINGIFPLIIKSGLVVFVSDIISFIIRDYGDVYKKNKYEKIKYINFLTENFPLIKSFLNTVKNNKEKTSLKDIYTFNVLYLGVSGGILIEIFLATIIKDIVGAILNIDHIAKILYPVPNAENFDMLKLNLVLLYSSCLNISFLIIFLFGGWWINSNKSKSLLTPLLTKTGKISSSAYRVFLSYWGFIGITIGASAVVYLLVYSYLLTCSAIREDLSFDLVHLNNLYITLKTNVLYLLHHTIVHILGMMLNLILIWGMYQKSKDFSSSVIKSTTDFYNCNFPYIKIKTGNGEIEGQLIDLVQNKSLVTLRDKSTLKTVPWDKIETMEVSPITKNG